MSSAQWFSALAAGSVIGAATSILINHFLAPRSVAGPPPGHVVAAPEAVAGAPATGGLVLAMLMAAATAASNSVGAEPPPAAKARSQGLSDEEQIAMMALPEKEARKVQIERFAAALRAHAEQPRDPRWARRATSALSSELAEADAAAGYRVVDCRTSSCVATLEYPDFDTARDSYANALHRKYEVNCTRTVVLGEPQSAGAPFRVDVLFDCGNERPELR
jgi:hypothetical protein